MYSSLPRTDLIGANNFSIDRILPSLLSVFLLILALFKVIKNSLACLFLRLALIKDLLKRVSSHAVNYADTFSICKLEALLLGMHSLAELGSLRTHFVSLQVGSVPIVTDVLGQLINLVLLGQILRVFPDGLLRIVLFKGILAHLLAVHSLVEGRQALNFALAPHLLNIVFGLLLRVPVRVQLAQNTSHGLVNSAPVAPWVHLYLRMCFGQLVCFLRHISSRLRQGLLKVTVSIKELVAPESWRHRSLQHR